MIDLVIPILKNGSKSGDIELQMCLRSIRKHLKGYRNIVIVGHLPSFINPETVIHIPFKDRGEGFKQSNIRGKILAAFDDPRVSDTIIFFNDDHFLLKDVEVSDFPFYYSGDLSTASEKAARVSGKELRQRGLCTKHFDIHAPIRYNRLLFRLAMGEIPNPNCSIKSIYANLRNIEGEELTDLKINTNLSYHRIKEAIEGRPCFSVGNYGVNRNMKQLWGELYPEPSIYELSNQILKVA